jgi:hypothetical protein
MLAKFPFVALIVSRPWYLSCQSRRDHAGYPLALVRFAGGRRAISRAGLGPPSWAAMTIFGLQGGGHQTRHLAPAYPHSPCWPGADPRLKTAGLVAVVALIGYGMSNALVCDPRNAQSGRFQTSTAGIVVRNPSETPR